jgi:hypothetical protein
MTLLTILIVLALLATIVALGSGVVAMMRGGEFDKDHSNQMMILRIGFQGAAVLLLFAALLLAA